MKIKKEQQHAVNSSLSIKCAEGFVFSSNENLQHQAKIFNFSTLML